MINLIFYRYFITKSNYRPHDDVYIHLYSISPDMFLSCLDDRLKCGFIDR